MSETDPELRKELDGRELVVAEGAALEAVQRWTFRRRKRTGSAEVVMHFEDVSP